MATKGDIICSVLGMSLVGGFINTMLSSTKSDEHKEAFKNGMIGGTATLIGSIFIANCIKKAEWL
jgi:hypothetical protein